MKDRRMGCRANVAPSRAGLHDRDMTMRIIAVALLLVLASATLHAAEPVPLLPAVGLDESAAMERAALFAALAAAKSDAEAREVEDRLWTFWRSLADEQSRQLLEKSHEAQLRFAYAEALTSNKAVVEHAPQFAEGWNQLGYVYFLAGDYDASLAAIEHVLTLEPMHYAALAGKGIILFYEGKVQDAQAPLKQALAINPWLKERNLIGKDLVPMP
jgi:tetratricopeptide (TPR) repeat protein